LEIAFSHNLWGLILLISLLLAAGITGLLYHKLEENRELSRQQLLVLKILRFMSVFLVAILFTGPLVKTIKKITQQPVVLLAVDNSRSMTGLKERDEKIARLGEVVENLTEGLKNRFEVITYTFGEHTLTNANPLYDERSSDYSDMLETVYNNHFNQNTGALVIIGDGIVNQGENPLNNVRKYGYPVYTIGTGDTTSFKDVRIEDVRVNRTAFSGNKFPVEADIRINGFQGRNFRFDIYHRGEKCFSRNIQATLPAFFLTVPLMLDATGSGLQHYSAVIDPDPGEQNRSNNSFPFVINVLENKQRILILSQGVHPDAGALKNALEQQINYEAELYTSEPYPSDLSEYNLLILNQIPSSSQSGRLLLDESGKHRIPILMVIGTQTFLPQFNAWGLGVEIAPRAGDFEEAQVSLNEGFALFSLSDALRENLTRYPPLKVPFARYSLDPEYQTAFFQKIKNIATPGPLMAFGVFDGRKSGIIFGEGIWRWRLYNYTISGSHTEFNELIDKMVQYLALRDNEDNFMVGFKPVYQETEPVVLTAEVYNDAYEMVNTSEVFITLRDSSLREYPYVFDKSSLFYRLNAGLFPPGNYTFLAKTTLGPTEYTETGNFAVMPVNMEMTDLQANHRILFQIAHETNGEFFPEEQAALVIDEIMDNDKIRNTNYFQTMMNEMINLRWIFFVLLFLLGIEWFLRKFWGIY